METTTKITRKKSIFKMLWQDYGFILELLAIITGVVLTGCLIWGLFTLSERYDNPFIFILPFAVPMTIYIIHIFIVFSLTEISHFKANVRKCYLPLAPEELEKLNIKDTLQYAAYISNQVKYRNYDSDKFFAFDNEFANIHYDTFYDFLYLCLTKLKAERSDLYMLRRNPVFSRFLHFDDIDKIEIIGNEIHLTVWNDNYFYENDEPIPHFKFIYKSNTMIAAKI